MSQRTDYHEESEKTPMAGRGSIGSREPKDPRALLKQATSKLEESQQVSNYTFAILITFVVIFAVLMIILYQYHVAIQSVFDPASVSQHWMTHALALGAACVGFGVLNFACTENRLIVLVVSGVVMLVAGLIYLLVLKSAGENVTAVSWAVYLSPIIIIVAPLLMAAVMYWNKFGASEKRPAKTWLLAVGAGVSTLSGAGLWWTSYKSRELNRPLVK